MKNLLEISTGQEMVQRIQQLTPSTPALWGKMNVAQMMAHCSGVINLYFESKPIKRPLVGVLFGGIIKRKMLSDKPWAKNLPTVKEVIITTTGDFEKEKAQLIQSVTRFATEGHKAPPMSHPFFGKMSTADWGRHQYKHLDHHLTQFGV